MKALNIKGYGLRLATQLCMVHCKVFALDKSRDNQNCNSNLNNRRLQKNRFSGYTIDIGYIATLDRNVINNTNN